MHRRMWAESVDGLARQYRVACWDLPGHGGSPSWPGWALADVAERFARILESPSILVGWSLGGQVVLEMAARNPEKVAGMVLIGTNPKFVAAGRWPGMEPEVFRAFFQAVEIDARAALNRFLGLVCQGSSGRNLRILRRCWRELPLPAMEDLLRGLAVLRDSDLRPVLSRIEVPSVVIAGEGDALVPLAAARCLADSLPCGRLITVEKGGHAPFLSVPEIILNAVHVLSGEI